VERRFWLLRRLSRLMGVLAWICLALVVLVVPVGTARALIAQSWEDLAETLGYGISGLVLFIMLLYMAQWIQVILALEENTRHATFVLEKLATLTQQVRDRVGALEDAAVAGREESRRPPIQGPGGSEPQ
jgi:hypothetical protein